MSVERTEPTLRDALDLERLKDRLSLHPMQYGYRNGEYVSEPGDDPTVVERYNRCPVCEQWSPCDFRLMVAEIERLRAGVSEEEVEAAVRAYSLHPNDGEWRRMRVALQAAVSVRAGSTDKAER